MNRQLPTLQVQLFGTEKIRYGDRVVLSGRNVITKAMKLLLILLYFGEQGISREKLLDALYGKDELANIGNNLRVTMHRMKKQLEEWGLPEYEYVVSKNGVYYWESPMLVEIDAHQFKQAVCDAEVQADEFTKFTFLKNACAMYQGDFLQKLSGEEWVLMESMQYKDMYAEALTRVVEFLMERREYEEVIRLIEPACEMYPFDEWQAVKIDCYIAMDRYQEALKEYEATSKMLLEEVGISPSEHMMEQFAKMSKLISNRPQNVQEIKATLEEDVREGGAFFCSLPGFRDVYRSIQRQMERSGQSVFLLVCTLTDSEGYPMMNSKKLDEMSEALYYAIKESLRRGDVFTKYNYSQYLVILMGTNESDCQIVIDRITKNYGLIHKTWEQHLQFGLSSVCEMA